MQTLWGKGGGEILHNGVTFKAHHGRITVPDGLVQRVIREWGFSPYPRDASELAADGSTARVRVEVPDGAASPNEIAAVAEIARINAVNAGLVAEIGRLNAQIDAGAPEGGETDAADPDADD